MVALYIYINKNITSSTGLTVDNTSVTADETDITADATILSGVTTTELTPVRIELFEDEKISLTSSIQNINDISKVFTDYSQSFTIPASDNNNEIFRHWYENSLDDGFDQRLRYDGYIEIDTQTFRVGKWQLESATIKNNRVEDYKITFYGNLKSLSDKFGEDKLKNLTQINDYTISYNGANVQSAITSSTAQNVMFPLISSDRTWEYGVGGTTDISLNAGKINYNELFPAVKVARIFDAIESKYNINFSGTFLNDDRFKNAYLWLKNGDAKRFISTTQRKQLTFNDNTTYLPKVFNIQDNTYNFVSSTLTYLGSGIYADNAKFTIVLSFPSIVNHTVFIYKDGELYTTLQFNANTSTVEIPYQYRGGAYTFYVECLAPTTYTYTYTFSYRRRTTTTTISTPSILLGTGSGSLNDNLNLTNYMPDIKTTDFLTGILKMFNLTAFSEDGINFTLEQLENWYYLGVIKDFSQYTISDNLEFTRIKPYKKINFEYEKSENLLSRKFFSNNSREYGNLSYTFNNDGSDYTIKLPFENLMFQKFTGTNLQVGYCLKSDLTTYEPKPLIVYRYGTSNCSFHFDNGSTHPVITTYNVFGQETQYQTEVHTLNWGVEISSYLLEPVSNSLFNNYYLNYLNNLYSLKSRMLKVKMRLPYLELLNLKLNDRIIIRDKRYVINQFTTDLTTFEVDFELIQDFRSVNFDNSRLVTINNTAQTLTFDSVSSNPIYWDVVSDTTGMVEDLTANEIDGVFYVILDIYANTSGLERNCTIKSNNNDLITIIQNA